MKNFDSRKSWHGCGALLSAGANSSEKRKLQQSSHETLLLTLFNNFKSRNLLQASYSIFEKIGYVSFFTFFVLLKI